ncbi:MAG: DUF4215 domain-containing protein [Deltaproteobacteria bacterium]|nr:DUF4215 domain-containing protein [Deltaproteobacteria bacterium]
MRKRRRQPGLRLCLATAAAGAVAALLAAHACATQDVRCGNGVVDPGEECDDNNLSNDDRCTKFCRLSICGDGIIERSSEQCDDRGTVPGDGCDAACRREGMECGDGTLDDVGSWPEECDDGNTTDGDGCSANCFNEIGTCGDGTRQYGEECDDGNTTPCDGCDEDCRTETAGSCDADATTETDAPDAPDGDARDGDAADGDGRDAETVDGETGDAEFVEGDGRDGDVADGDAADGDGDAAEARDGWDCTDPVCDLAPQCGCGSGEKCTLIGSGRGCGPTGFLAEGRACTSDSECGSGLYCAPAVDTSVFFCHRFCEADGDCLGPGSRCLVPITGGSPPTTLGTLCTVNCDLESGSGCPEGARCKVFSDADGDYLTDCSGEVGSGRLGHACSDESDCAAGYFCSPSFPTCLQYCVFPDGYCDGGYVCRSFAPPVLIGTRTYGYCG